MAGKPAWLFNQSAVIPYLLEDGNLKVVLITSNSSRHWVIPKGVIERDMTPSESAAKEALEEAGIIGETSEEVITEYHYDKWGGTCHVQVFPMRVTAVLDEWDEMHARKREIVAAELAITQVKPVLRKVLEEFVERFRSNDI